MIVLMVATALASVTPANGGAALAAPATVRCDIRRGPCGEADASRYRLPFTEGSDHDSKMDAVRLNARPCGLIGHARCARKGREIFRLGEPIGRTLSRSLGMQ